MNSLIIIVIASILVAVVTAQRQPNKRPILGSPCHQAAQNANKRQGVGRFVPVCDEFGNYAARQCHAGTQYCQCVAHDGSPLTEKRRDVEGCECVRKVSDAKSSNSNSSPVLGAITLRCSKNGSYENKQCHASTGLCWCVDPSGQQLGEQVRGPLNC